MLLKLHSSLLFLTVLVLSVMVASKPTFRHHRRGDSKLGATKTLKPLKQYNIRQHPTKREFQLATIPKPSKYPSIPIPIIVDTKTSDNNGIIPAIPKNLPGSGGTNTPNTSNSLLNNVNSILQILGNQAPGETLGVNSPAVKPSGQTLTGNTTVNPKGGLLTEDGTVGSDLLDHDLKATKSN